MTGKKQQSALSSQPSAVKGADGSSRVATTAFCLLPSAYSRRGFTLLELMIVISIIIILAMIVLPQYNATVRVAKEAVLRDNLTHMRKAIDQYAADKGKLPPSPDDLVSSGYLHEIPVDPMTERAEWNWEFGEDPHLLDGGQGIKNVYSSSSDTSDDGQPYSQW